eukprot:Hpha_TRINITY_DN300_c0_g1::TRINITY_DN300_c0_g1_i1::g.112571::m.112571
MGNVHARARVRRSPRREQPAPPPPPELHRSRQLLSGGIQLQTILPSPEPGDWSAGSSDEGEARSSHRSPRNSHRSPRNSRRSPRNNHSTTPSPSSPRSPNSSHRRRRRRAHPTTTSKSPPFPPPPPPQLGAQVTPAQQAPPPPDTSVVSSSRQRTPLQPTNQPRRWETAGMDTSGGVSLSPLSPGGSSMLTPGPLGVGVMPSRPRVVPPAVPPPVGSVSSPAVVQPVGVVSPYMPNALPPPAAPYPSTSSPRSYSKVPPADVGGYVKSPGSVNPPLVLNSTPAPLPPRMTPAVVEAPVRRTPASSLGAPGSPPMLGTVKGIR